MPKISIIIPVYNSGKYLAQCLESLLGQNVSDFEIICINDGSTDDSLGILQFFKKKDSRIRIIDQINQGVSASRNAGLEVARGIYIGFVDADDTVDHDYFSNLLFAAEKYQCNVVYSNAFDHNDDLQKNKLYSKSEINFYILPQFFRKDCYNSSCNKLFAAEVIKKHKIKFPIGKTNGEDAEFNIHFLVHADTVYIYNYSGYNYREVEGSATRNVREFCYLKNAVVDYKKDWSVITGLSISEIQMSKLKKERFINNIISLIFIYSNPGNKLKFLIRIQKLREIVRDKYVENVFSAGNLKWVSSSSKYKREIFKSIERKNILELYLLSLYSYYRNR